MVEQMKPVGIGMSNSLASFLMPLLVPYLLVIWGDPCSGMLSFCASWDSISVGKNTISFELECNFSFMESMILWSLRIVCERYSPGLCFEMFMMRTSPIKDFQYER